MSTVFIIFITIAAVTLIFSIIPFVLKNEKKRKQELCKRLSQEGIANNLTFCSQEILQNKVIGIDGIHGKILILEKIKNTYNSYLISLDEVQNCELVSTYASHERGNYKRLTAGKKQEAIELRFEFKNHARAASIRFYDGLINSKRELDLLKEKAAFWNVMLSKMLTRQVRARA